MTTLEKIYTDDPDIKYKSTTIKPVRTKSEIDGLLSRWGIKTYGWHYDESTFDIELRFQLNEKFQEREINPWVAIRPPPIWRKATRKNPEHIDIAVSMRTLFWYIKSQLEMAYAMQSRKTIAFLPYVQTKDGQVKDLVGHFLTALPAPATENKREKNTVIDV